jgi:outer membrane receptor protein involved in Fe transport
MNRHSKSALQFNAAQTRSIIKLSFTFASCTLLLTARSFGQTAPIEEIVVTADFRQATINDIPASISVLDSALIQSKNALHLEDILLNAPNVNVASGASRSRFYQIRGIGERGQFTEPLNSSVGLIIDGVDFSGIGNAAMLYDIEQVEVLMGPQGTRYGSNALAGLINLQSRAPTDELSYGMQLQGENYNSVGLAGYVSGPISDELAYRLSLQSIESDGYGTNLFLNKPTNTRDEFTARGKLRWQPAPDVTLDLTTALIDIDNGYDAFSLDNTRDTLSDNPGMDEQDSRLGSLKLTLANFEPFTLEALASVVRSNTAYGYDEDWVYAGFHPDEYSSTDLFEREHDTASAEVRLLSTDAGALLGGRTSWITGIYSLQQEVELVRTYTFLSGPFTSSFDVDRLAVYADTSTKLSTHWSLDAGLRSERYEAGYQDSDNLDFDPAETLFGGKLALNYHTDADNLIYASISRGYKSGGFNTDGSLDADLREFDTEVLWNYELGFKGQLWNDRLQIQSALFFMDRDDVQISSSTVRMRSDGSSEFIDYIGNAATGTNFGLELSTQLRLTDTVNVYSSLGLLDTEYQDFINSEGQDLDGRQQAHAPRYQYTIGTGWELFPGLALDVNVQGRDSFYFSDSHDSQSKPYDLVNASLTWTHRQWQAILWGRNLTDEDVAVRGYYFGNDPRDGYTAKDYTQLGEPLRYGLTVKLDF